MSTVVLDTITGKSTATTITIGSTPVVSASANSMTIRGEGSNQTSIQQGLVKHWCNLQADGFSINDSFNNSSCTDFATCNYAYTYTNALANNDYCPSGFVRDGGSVAFLRGIQGIDGSNFSTTTITLRPVAAGASEVLSNFDPAHVCLSITGDLA